MKFILKRSSDWRKTAEERKNEQTIEIDTLGELLEFIDNATHLDGQPCPSIVLERGQKSGAAWQRDSFWDLDSPWRIEIYDDYRE